MSTRFIRLPSGAVGGVKLASRLDVNPSLVTEVATSPDQFRARLERRLGPADVGSDAAFSFAVRDVETGVSVRAYSAQSGPAYGGMPDECFVDYDGGDYQLRDEVLRTLRDLDAWLENT